MKSLFVIVILFVILIGTMARADVLTASTTGDSIVFTNTQSNFAWTPTALVITRDLASSVTLAIYRHGNGQVVLLSSITATASNLIWVPEAHYQFPQHSALVISASVTNFSVQLHRGPAHE